MKNLIVYYSFTENNEKLAGYLQKLLNCDTVKIETIKNRTGFSILLDLVFNRKPKLKAVASSLEDYEHVIFMAPIWAGKIATPLKSFLTDEKTRIKSYSFITLCGGGNSTQKQKIQQELSLVVQKEPSNVLELWVSDLLSAEKKNSVKYTSGFRVEVDGLAMFKSQIQDFIEKEKLISTALYER